MSSLKIELALLMSFVYIINNNRPKMDPCGTPVIIFLKLDLMPPNGTYCLRFDE